MLSSYIHVYAYRNNCLIIKKSNTKRMRRTLPPHRLLRMPESRAITCVVRITGPRRVANEVAHDGEKALRNYFRKALRLALQMVLRMALPICNTKHINEYFKTQTIK